MGIVTIVVKRATASRFAGFKLKRNVLYKLSSYANRGRYIQIYFEYPLRLSHQFGKTQSLLNNNWVAIFSADFRIAVAVWLKLQSGRIA